MIGLIYASDFGYAGTNCDDDTLANYEISCGPGSNWLTDSSTYWTISSLASDGVYSWRIRRYDGESGGCTNSYHVQYSFGVRPTLYLDSNVQIIGGDGSLVPYKLK